MVRLPRRPARRPAAQALSVAGFPAAQPVVDRQAAPSVEEDRAAARIKANVLATFESALREQPGLEREELDSLIETYRKAIDETPLEATFKPYDPDDLAQALNGLVAAGAIDEDDRNSLARQFEGMLEPLQDKGIQVAVEFAERCERDGEEQAIAWLEKQRAAALESKQATQAGLVGQMLEPKQASVRRSHRSRAPPV